MNIHKKSITGIIVLLCLTFLAVSMFTGTVIAQSNKVAGLTWNGNMDSATVLAPNAFGQVITSFSPSETIVVTSLDFSARGVSASVALRTDKVLGMSGSGVLASGSVTLNDNFDWTTDKATLDFSSTPQTLIAGNVYYIGIINQNNPTPMFLFATTSSQTTWSASGAYPYTNDLFFEVYGTVYNQPTPTPYGNYPTPTPFNNYPTPTPYNGYPTPTPYTYPTPTQPPTYILGYGFSSQDLIIIVIVIAIIFGCAVFVSVNLNKSNRPRKNGKKHK